MKAVIMRNGTCGQDSRASIKVRTVCQRLASQVAFAADNDCCWQPLKEIFAQHCEHGRGIMQKDLVSAVVLAVVVQVKL